MGPHSLILGGGRLDYAGPARDWRGPSVAIGRRGGEVECVMGWETGSVLMPLSTGVEQPTKNWYGHCEEPEPDPIPNSAVKLLCADDTSS